MASSVDGLSCGAYQHGFDSFYLCHHKISCQIFTSNAPNTIETIKGKENNESDKGKCIVREEVS